MSRAMRSHQVHNLSGRSWQTPGVMKGDVCSSVQVLDIDHESMMRLNRCLKIRSVSEPICGVNKDILN